MSQRSVETIIGKLVTDEAFRQQFFVNPVHACLCAGIHLHAEELDALVKINRKELLNLATSIDGRIRKACLSCIQKEKPK